MPEALKKADEVLQQAVQGITDLINVPALINLDFADVKTVMTDRGVAHIGIGSAKGDDKAAEAVKIAVTSPLLETTIAGAEQIIINISGDVGLIEADEAASYVQQMAGDQANIIFGVRYDENMVDECVITVIATGLEDAGANPFGQAKTFSYQPTSAVKNLNGVKPQAPVGQATQPKQQISFKTQPVESRVVEKIISIPEFLQRNMD